MDEGEVSDSGPRIVVKRFRRRTGTRLPLADSQDECVTAAAETASQAREASVHVCSPHLGPASLLPLASKTHLPASRPPCLVAQQQPLSPPGFAPVRPFLRWGSQSMAPACLRPKLPSSTLLGAAPAEPSGPRLSGPYQPAPCSGLPRPPLRPTPRSLARRPPAALPAAPSGPMSPAKPQWQAASCMHQAQDSCPTLPPPPKARRLRPTTSRMQADSKREDLRQLFFFILHRIEHDCNLHLQLASSQHFAQHVSRLLAPFSVGTLKQYLNACLHSSGPCVKQPVSAWISLLWPTSCWRPSPAERRTATSTNARPSCPSRHCAGWEKSSRGLKHSRGIQQASCPQGQEGGGTNSNGTPGRLGASRLQPRHPPQHTPFPRGGSCMRARQYTLWGFPARRLVLHSTQHARPARNSLRN